MAGVHCDVFSDSYACAFRQCTGYASPFPIVRLGNPVRGAASGEGWMTCIAQAQRNHHSEDTVALLMSLRLVPREPCASFMELLPVGPPREASTAPEQHRKGGTKRERESDVSSRTTPASAPPPSTKSTGIGVINLRPSNAGGVYYFAELVERGGVIAVVDRHTRTGACVASFLQRRTEEDGLLQREMARLRGVTAVSGPATSPSPAAPSSAGLSAAVWWCATAHNTVACMDAETIFTTATPTEVLHVPQISSSFGVPVGGGLGLTAICSQTAAVFSAGGAMRVDRRAPKGVGSGLAVASPDTGNLRSATLGGADHAPMVVGYTTKRKLVVFDTRRAASPVYCHESPAYICVKSNLGADVALLISGDQVGVMQLSTLAILGAAQVPDVCGVDSILDAVITSWSSERLGMRMSSANGMVADWTMVLGKKTILKLLGLPICWLEKKKKKCVNALSFDSRTFLVSHMVRSVFSSLSTLSIYPILSPLSLDQRSLLHVDQDSLVVSSSMRCSTRLSVYLPFAFTKSAGGVVGRYEKERLDPTFLQERRADAKARMIICRSEGKANPELFLRCCGTSASTSTTAAAALPGEHPAFHPLSQQTLQPNAGNDLLFLGEDTAERSLFLAPTAAVSPAYLSSGCWTCSREIFTSSIAAADLNAVGLAISVEQWRTATKFCSACGAAFTAEHFAHDHFTCGQCRRLVYPSMTPAVIITVLDGRGMALLCQNTRKPLSPGGRPLLTILAGFVSPGETLEEAVVREVEEESHARVTQLAYVGSQPYPFPAQMMSCYYGVADSAAPIKPQEGEILQVRWVPKAEVQQALQQRHPEFDLPPPYTATHLLLSSWANGQVDDHGVWVGAKL
eukprot:gene10909-7567_t